MQGNSCSVIKRTFMLVPQTLHHTGLTFIANSPITLSSWVTQDLIPRIRLVIIKPVLHVGKCDIPFTSRMQ
ncbi:hypothetical protein Pmani_022870 [Petrolisthes manimaculis]|uniref:Uncharacterized protein n=1 Tax=Petrolisthes manimaculis TaxID=1843537 RepID=A0AAE1PD75_9EUCA|nr:hypothetical protein Pmani_022870 [Petrolisthes manimaculis]